jgi:hypothetical protein
MNIVELQRALRQLRCSGIAAALEARLLEAHPGAWPRPWPGHAACVTRPSMRRPRRG